MLFYYLVVSNEFSVSYMKIKSVSKRIWKKKPSLTLSQGTYDCWKEKLL